MEMYIPKQTLKYRPAGRDGRPSIQLLDTLCSRKGHRPIHGMTRVGCFENYDFHRLDPENVGK